MERTDLTFSQLLEEMRKAVANAGRLAQRDTLTDLVTLTSEYEACRESGFAKNEIIMHHYWGVRQNGTGFTSSQKVIDQWMEGFKNQAIAVYEITFKEGFYSIRLYASFDDADLIFGISNFK